MQPKTCPKCGAQYENPAQHFHKNPRSCDGLARYCKPCQCAMSRRAYRRSKRGLIAKIRRGSRNYDTAVLFTADEATLFLEAGSLPPGLKKCTRCRKIHPATKEYWHTKRDRNGRRYFHSRCKACRKIDRKADYDKHHKTERRSPTPYIPLGQGVW
jgi:hypothetical protein